MDDIERKAYMWALGWGGGGGGDITSILLFSVMFDIKSMIQH